MSDFKHIVGAYTESFARHGDSAAAVLCPKGRQHVRFDIMVAEITGDGFSLLDFGCGLGHMLSHLAPSFPGIRYHGVDIVPEFIRANRERFGERARFDVVEGDFSPAEDYDYVFISGTFNLRYFEDDEKNLRFIERRIATLFNRTRRVLTCDFMTSYVDFKQKDAFHVDPGAMSSFVRHNLTRRFKMRHDYLPYEFAMVLYKNDVIIRPENVYPE